MALSLEQYQHKFDYNKDTLIKDILTKRNERQRKKTLGVLIKNGNQIPEDLITEILSRLPVKALLQFKSVCKLWYDIIKSSYFISKQLRNYYDNNSNWRDCLLVQYSAAGELNLFEWLINDTKIRALSYQEIETPVSDTYLCGPCDGIYYLCCSNDDLGPEHSLWNPALNEFKILPEISCWKPNLPPDSTYTTENYGFGYDSKSDDYKVILILGYCNTRDDNSRMSDNPMSILIYSLRTNSWRYWGDIDINSYYLKLNKSYVFVNGCYYWLAALDEWLLVPFGSKFDKIISFDISAETCQEIPSPQFESWGNYVSELIVYQDSIAFVLVPRDDYCSSFIRIWTWNEGVWTQKFSIKLDFMVWGAFSAWRGNMLVFTSIRQQLVLCDTNTKEIFVLDGRPTGVCQYICAYKESLISIKDFRNDVKHKGRTS